MKTWWDIIQLGWVRFSWSSFRCYQWAFPMHQSSKIVGHSHECHNYWWKEESQDVQTALSSDLGIFSLKDNPQTIYSLWIPFRHSRHLSLPTAIWEKEEKFSVLPSFIPFLVCTSSENVPIVAGQINTLKQHLGLPFPGHLCIHNHQQALSVLDQHCRVQNIPFFSCQHHCLHILYESPQFASTSPLSVPIIPSVQLLEWAFLKGSLTRNSLQADHHTVHFKFLSDSLLTCFPSISCPLQPNHTDFLFSLQILHTQSYSEQPALALFPMFSLVTWPVPLRQWPWLRPPSSCSWRSYPKHLCCSHELS